MSIAAKTKQYIISRPAIQECLRRGVVNFSALAREIAQNMKLEDTTAIVAATIRYSKQLKKASLQDRKIEKALRNSEVNFTTDIVLFAIGLPLSDKQRKELMNLQMQRFCKFFEGVGRGIVIGPQVYSSTVRKSVKSTLIVEYQDLVQIRMSQSVEVMGLPGVAARLFALMGEAGIVVYDCIMVAGEHIMFCHVSDLPKVAELIHGGYLGRQSTKKSFSKS